MGTTRRNNRHISRRRFLGQSIGFGAALGAGIPILSSCGGDDDSSDGPVAEGIGDGLEPEAGPLKVFNYPDYVSPDVLAKFEEQYGVTVEVTTFDVDSEAITKLASGAVDVDVHHSCVPSTLERLIQGGLLQPLNASYLTNRSNVLSAFDDPWYDPGSRYTVPYTVYASGIGYRADKIDKAEVDERGWDMFWDERFKGVTSILDDYREGIALALLRSGNTDINTTDVDAINLAGEDLQKLVDLVNVKVNITGYTDVPEGATHLAHTWSGDMLAGAANYLPDGTDASVLGWWFPADNQGPVGNDCLAVTANAENPVLAHLYINFLLDAAIAEENWYWNGYLPPIKGLDAAYLVGQELTPPNLQSAVLTDDVIRNGLVFEPLDLDTDKAWEAAWSRFTAG
jgi:spermidine/putrescine transport system substrate-binding protein